jgi:V/A-type H+/Na+-transporting ATPase subunit E
MATTLEDFVAKLHAEGVASGRAEAEQIIAEARRAADAIRREAEDQARLVVERAEQEAATRRARAETELTLAARDTLLALRSALGRCLDALLRRTLAPPLRDPGLLAELLSLLVREYARADAAGARHIEIQVPHELAARLELRALHELARSAQAGTMTVDVRGSLCDAGFEYRIAGGKVEVTLDAVVERVREVVRPGLWGLLDEAALMARTALTEEEPAQPVAAG